MINSVSQKLLELLQKMILQNNFGKTLATSLEHFI